MTDTDALLHQLAAGSSFQPDWQDVLRRAGEAPVARTLASRRKLLIALAVAAVAVVLPLVAMAAANDWWFFAHGAAPTPTHAPIVVRSGTWNGHAWELVAYPSTTDGLCFGVTPKSTAATTGRGAALACAPFVGVSRTHRTKQSPDMSITYLDAQGGPLPNHIVGPVIGRATSVRIRLRNGRTLHTRTFPAPTPLQHVRFFVLTATPYAAPRPGPDLIQWIAGLDANGRVVACLAPATARNGISPLKACH